MHLRGGRHLHIAGRAAGAVPAWVRRWGATSAERVAAKRVRSDGVSVDLGEHLTDDLRRRVRRQLLATLGVDDL